MPTKVPLAETLVLTPTHTFGATKVVLVGLLHYAESTDFKGFVYASEGVDDAIKAVREVDEQKPLEACIAFGGTIETFGFTKDDLSPCESIIVPVREDDSRMIKMLYLPSPISRWWTDQENIQKAVISVKATLKPPAPWTRLYEGLQCANLDSGVISTWSAGQWN